LIPVLRSLCGSLIKHEKLLRAGARLKFTWTSFALQVIADLQAVSGKFEDGKNRSPLVWTFGTEDIHRPRLLIRKKGEIADILRPGNNSGVLVFRQNELYGAEDLLWKRLSRQVHPRSESRCPLSFEISPDLRSFFAVSDFTEEDCVEQPISTRNESEENCRKQSSKSIHCDLVDLNGSTGICGCDNSDLMY